MSSSAPMTKAPSPVPRDSDPDTILLPLTSDSIAVAARLGFRPRMEDAFIVINPNDMETLTSQIKESVENSSSPSNPTSNSNPTSHSNSSTTPSNPSSSSSGVSTFRPCLFGVFDGHSSDKRSEDGKVASRSVSHLIPRHFLAHLHYGDSVHHSLHRAFQLTDQSFTTLKLPGAGTTSTVIYLSDQDLYSANVGDSRAILVETGGKTVELTKDHTPYDPEEAARVESEGGHLLNYHGLRVEGRLNMTRAIGDSELPGVSATPTIRHLNLNRDGKKEIDGVIVMASDGLWAGVSNDQVGSLVEQYRQDGVAAIAKQLTKAAVKGRSTDNTIILVIDLQKLKQQYHK